MKTWDRQLVAALCYWETCPGPLQDALLTSEPPLLGLVSLSLKTSYKAGNACREHMRHTVSQISALWNFKIKCMQPNKKRKFVRPRWLDWYLISQRGNAEKAAIQTSRNSSMNQGFYNQAKIKIKKQKHHHLWLLTSRVLHPSSPFQDLTRKNFGKWEYTGPFFVKFLSMSM